MGNTPIQNKRRASGEDLKFTTVYGGVTIPPQKKRNVKSLGSILYQTSHRPEMLDDEDMDNSSTSSIFASGHDPTSDVTNYPLVTAIGGEVPSGTSSMKSCNQDSNAIHSSMSAGDTKQPETMAEFMDYQPSVDGTEVRRYVLDRMHSHYADEVDLNQMSKELCWYDDSQVKNKCPTVFQWKGGGREIAISGSFTKWKKVPMVKRDSGTYLIINCPPGEHEYKYFIDGAWYHDPTKPTHKNEYGTLNNAIYIDDEEVDVLNALEHDATEAAKQKGGASLGRGYSRRERGRSNSTSDTNTKRSTLDNSGVVTPSSVGAAKDNISSRKSSGHVSPPGEYNQIVPRTVDDVPSVIQDSYSGPPAPGIGTNTQPPLLPAQLNIGLLNQAISPHSDPNLLPHPAHVVVNHLYALSIKDGVIVLSVITRYRHKFVSTLFYKPIPD